MRKITHEKLEICKKINTYKKKMKNQLISTRLITLNSINKKVENKIKNISKKRINIYMKKVEN